MTGGVLALDVATTTGWACGRPGDRPTWGSFRAGGRDRGVETGEVLHRFRLWLDERLGDWRPDWIVFEAPYVPRAAPTRIGNLPPSAPPIDIKVLRRLFALCGVVEMVAWQHQIRCREEASNVICRHFTGHGSWGGRAEKKAATQRMCAAYGWHDVSQDEADALALWAYAEAVLHPPAALRRGVGPLFVRASAAAKPSTG